MVHLLCTMNIHQNEERLPFWHMAKRGFQVSSDKSSSWFPLTQNLANRAIVRPDFDTNRYILTGVRGRGSLNCMALWISCLDTWPKILDTYMAKIDLQCPQFLLYCYV